METLSRGEIGLQGWIGGYQGVPIQPLIPDFPITVTKGTPELGRCLPECKMEVDHAEEMVFNMGPRDSQIF
jgi:hypothetical protein